MKELLQGFVLLIFFAFLTNGCTKDEREHAYVQEIFEFRVVDAGDSYGYCGPVLLTRVNESSNYEYYKPNNLPPDISFGLESYYKGVFEILPGRYDCKNNIPDPRPGDTSPTIHTQFVNILEWKLK